MRRMERNVVAPGRLLFVMLMAAAVSAQPALQQIPDVCPHEDAEALGISCSEGDPCPVFFEATGVEGVGARIFVTGNLHTSDTTMFGLLLSSDDSGKTWGEPIKRLRGGSLEHVQFADAQHGWIAGMMLDPLPRGPFILSTVDDGDTWHRTPISADPGYGSVTQMWFDSMSRGELVMDRSQGKVTRFEMYASSDGGGTWTLKSSKDEPLHLTGAAEPQWRAAVIDGAYAIQHRAGADWETLARFPAQAGECK